MNMTYGQQLDNQWSAVQSNQLSVAQSHGVEEARVSHEAHEGQCRN